MKTNLSSIFILLLFATGCSANSKGISGNVVDAETGHPIEGAVVLVEWTRATGIGDKHTSSVKVVEKVTDKAGKFSVFGTLKPFVDPPDVTVYKRGYVAWSSRNIFPDYRNRTDFQRGVAHTFRLERFKSAYSYDEHSSFIRSATNSSLDGEKSLIEEAYRWEELEAFKERSKKWERKEGAYND